MNKYDYQFKRNIALGEAIGKCNTALKELNKTYGKDPLCWQFVEDVLQILEKNMVLLHKNLDQIKFEINKEKSARCKNLDEFIAMIFDDK